MPKDRKQQYTCPICQDPIEDSTARKPGQDSIHCDGRCKTWVHRGCAGLSQAAFKTVSQSGKSFLCPACRLDDQSHEIASLKHAVANLSQELAEIKSQLGKIVPYVPSLGSSTNPSDALEATSLETPLLPFSYSQALRQDKPHYQNSGSVNFNKGRERKYNLIVFGLKESSKGTPKHVRNSNDQSSIATIFSSINESVNELSIRDYFRLGKYDENRSRPLLVKLTRASDVSMILSGRSKLSTQPGITIKPDLSREDRAIESVLLKERRSLIDSGTERRLIKIKGSVLYLNNKKYGSVTGTKFSLVSGNTASQNQPSLNPSLSPLQSQSPSHNTPITSVTSPSSHTSNPTLSSM